jgi:hypothetical protein
LNLGDEVEVDSDAVLQHVILRSGQTTFRVWFGGQTAQARQAAVEAIESMKPLMEWSSENLLALSVPAAQEAQRLADFLHTYESRGLLQYKAGRTA